MPVQLRKKFDAIAIHIVTTRPQYVSVEMAVHTAQLVAADPVVNLGERILVYRPLVSVSMPCSTRIVSLS